MNMNITIFTETIADAIKKYRHYLRKTMQQADRVAKLNQLNLKNVTIYSGDLLLYKMAWNIVRDIEENNKKTETGYYSYSGISKFCEYLKGYLENYDLYEGQIIHRAQRASRSILTAIQLLNGKAAHELNDITKKEAQEQQAIITRYGNEEQLNLYRLNLLKLKNNAPLFFTDLLRHLDLNTKDSSEIAA